MASAEHLGDLFANLSAGEKQKIMRQLTAARARDARARKHGLAPLAPKKAVNGFMAFRSYYANLFAGLQQKERSPFLRRLYDTDPFHAEWDFVARVYSHIRNDVLDLGHQTPLRVFLATACPIMGMIAPEAYFDTCGWRLMHIGNGDKDHDLRCDEGAEERINSIRKTTPPLNGCDLLLRCLAAGYEVHSGQELLCRMMERQEHLMTKSFAQVPLAPSSPFRRPSSTATGNLLTWSNASQSSPSPDPDQVPSLTGHEPGGHLIQFDKITTTDTHPHASFNSFQQSHPFVEGSFTQSQSSLSPSRGTYHQASPYHQNSPDGTSTTLNDSNTQHSADENVEGTEISYQLDLPGEEDEMYKFNFGDEADLGSFGEFLAAGDAGVLEAYDIGGEGGNWG